jgi:hypothetical protein
LVVKAFTIAGNGRNTSIFGTFNITKPSKLRFLFLCLGKNTKHKKVQFVDLSLRLNF